MCAVDVAISVASRDLGSPYAFCALQDEREEDENGYRRRERFVGKWERRFQLPENVRLSPIIVSLIFDPVCSSSLQSLYS